MKEENIKKIIINNYNEIFKTHNEKVEDFSTWYHNFYGSYGAQEIKEIDNSFHISIICHNEFKNIVISFEDMIERIYLYDKYILEGRFMFSHNSGKMSNDMKTSPSCDGFFIILNDSNREFFEKEIKKDVINYIKPSEVEEISLENIFILETFT